MIEQTLIVLVILGVNALCVYMAVLNCSKNTSPKVLRWTYIISNQNSSLPRNTTPELLLSFDVIDPYDSFHSPIFKLPGLLVYKVCTLLLICGTIVQMILSGDNIGAKEFIYFTNWTWALISLTTLLGSYIGFTELLRGQKQRHAYSLVDAQSALEDNSAIDQMHSPNATTQGRMRQVQSPRKPLVKRLVSSLLENTLIAAKLHTLMMQTSLISGAVVAAFFWGILAPQMVEYTGGISFSNKVRHGWIQLAILGDFLVSRQVVCSSHLFVTMAFFSLYFLFQLVVDAIYDVWVYTVLDWSKWVDSIYYAMIPVLIFCSFLLLVGLAYVRKRMLSIFNQAKSSRYSAAGANVELSVLVEN